MTKANILYLHGILHYLSCFTIVVHSFSFQTQTNLQSSQSQLFAEEHAATANEFSNFDYESQWYPVIWGRDLELNEPTKVTVFDVDYVVARLENNEVIAMKDVCTHKQAALSEGRVTSSGNFQCAYHGWSFDGKSGECVEIPQIVQNRSDEKGGAKIPARACGDAVPAQIHQDMVWLFPGGNLEKALLAPPPPSIPEFDDFHKIATVRDMPVDWPIVMSNILDPDHGLFAHQNAGFDWYTASLDCPYDSFESFSTEKGWGMRSQVEAKDKLLVVDQKYREAVGESKKKKLEKERTDISIPLATMEFHAPTHATLKRVDKNTGKTNFITTFYLCPVGVGRTRFMGGALTKFKLPRWFFTINLNGFLDQDTYLLATQQPYILKKEAQDIRNIMKEHGIARDKTEKIKGIRTSTRQKLFCLPSPTEKVGAKLEQFWDTTLTGVPNRVETLLKMDDANIFATTPSREVVLDRKVQNLDISKESRDVVKNCKKIRIVSKGLAFLLGIAKIATLNPLPGSLIMWFMPALRPILKLKAFLPLFTILLLANYLSRKLESKFYFTFDDDMRKADMKKIPEKIWLDKLM